MRWLTESNRLKHFAYAIPASLLLTILFAMGLAVGMEVKDKLYGNKFDYLDLLATFIGGVVGQSLQLILFSLIL